jgi:hypothetical protein
LIYDINDISSLKSAKRPLYDATTYDLNDKRSPSRIIRQPGKGVRRSWPALVLDDPLFGAPLAAVTAAGAGMPFMRMVIALLCCAALVANGSC